MKCADNFSTLIFPIKCELSLVVVFPEDICGEEFLQLILGEVVLDYDFYDLEAALN